MYTLSGPSEGLYKERGSRFVSYAAPARNREEAEAVVRRLRAEHPDSRHVCYAFRFGEEKMCSDAGEPAHSAGDPILRVALSAKLTHVVFVVVRYFGGVKLGVPGLIRAYSAAAQAALAQNVVVPFVPTRRISLVFDYAQTSAVKKIMDKFRIVESGYDERCRYVVELPESDWEATARALAQARIECMDLG